MIIALLYLKKHHMRKQQLNMLAVRIIHNEIKGRNPITIAYAVHEGTLSKYLNWQNCLYWRNSMMIALLRMKLDCSQVLKFCKAEWIKKSSDQWISLKLPWLSNVLNTPALLKLLVDVYFSSEIFHDWATFPVVLKEAAIPPVLQVTAHLYLFISLKIELLSFKIFF